MKTCSVSRILAVTVLTLTLAAAAAPAAWAVPGAEVAAQGAAWDLASAWAWFQGLFDGWLGGSVEKEGNLQNVTANGGHVLEPDGADLRARTSVSVELPGEAPSADGATSL